MVSPFGGVGWSFRQIGFDRKTYALKDIRPERQRRAGSIGPERPVLPAQAEGLGGRRRLARVSVLKGPFVRIASIVNGPFRTNDRKQPFFFFPGLGPGLTESALQAE